MKNTVNTGAHITKTPTHYKTHTYTHPHKLWRTYYKEKFYYALVGMVVYADKAMCVCMYLCLVNRMHAQSTTDLAKISLKNVVSSLRK